MRTFIVGDIQGCLKPLQCLLEQAGFDSGNDELWSVGDIVNRGPDSLATLRFLKSLGNRFRMVLGNHDLHLLAIAFGSKQARKGDTVSEILSAADRNELLDWLRHQPLLYRHNNAVLVHAGIPPLWSIEKAAALAGEVETVLRSDRAIEFFDAMYGNSPDCWNDELSGMERLRVITNYLTRMRVCRSDSTLDLSFKEGLDTMPAGFLPWFDHRSASKQDGDTDIFFGHWAALPAQTYHVRYHALDSGCVWGKQLTLYELATRKRFYCTCG